MTKERKLQIIKWLKSKKLECEYKALTEMEHHGAEVYIVNQNCEAAMIQEIIDIVENGFVFRKHLEQAFGDPGDTK
jgi:hypothetical protein